MDVLLPASFTISMHKKRRWIEGVKECRFDLDDVVQGQGSLDDLLFQIKGVCPTFYICKNQTNFKMPLIPLKRTYFHENGCYFYPQK